jgi:alkanesulfonate monooxygenase SsuD/methylene tetrahydromethanopterin reductase-like flavin-dependent oxidoreductase (luciferase family)
VTAAPAWGFAVNNFYGGEAAEVEAMLALGPRVEAVGFDSLWLGDHVLWHTPIIDALSLLGAYAATTERITLGTAILLLGLRQPGIGAKTLTSLNAMSGGRLVLGLGVGGENPAEFEFAGVSHERRGALLDAALERLVAQWDGEAEVSPTGPRPPILIGGRSNAARRRIRRFDAGWLASFVSPRRVVEEKALLDEEAGRDVPIYLNAYTAVGADGGRTRKDAAEFLGRVYAMDSEPLMRYAVVGDPEECAEQLSAFVAAGVSHFVLRPALWDQAEQCEIWAEQLLPLLRSAPPVGA